MAGRQEQGSVAERAVELLEEIYRQGVDESVDDLDEVIPWSDVFNVIQDYREGVSEDARFPELVEAEIARARQGHPPQNSLHEGYAVLLEEVDEFWDEVKLRGEKRSPQRTLKELVHVAAMARRTAEDMDLVVIHGN